VTERVVSVRLALKNNGFVAGMRQAKHEVKGFSDDLTKGAVKHKRDLDQLGKVSAGVGLAAAAGIGLAIKKFADFDKSMSNVRAATHETAGNMQALRDAALDAGKRTAFSATQAAGAIENLAKAGVSTKDILGGGLNGALDLAAAGELDVAQAAEIAATAMTQFKLSGKDVPHIADLLAAGAGKAQGEVSDLAQALNQSGLVASQFGLSVEETTGTLAAFASAGLLGSDAGTSFKTMLLRLANPMGNASELMDELGIHAYDAQGAFIGIAPLAEQLQSKLKNLSQEQRDSALATIFGSDAIRAANVLYQNGAKGIADWTTKVNDSGYAAETAAIKQDNLRGDIEKLGGSFETALIKSGGGANDVLRKLTQAVGAAVDGFTELPDEVQTVAAALASVAAIGGLSAVGLIKAVTAASELRESWKNLGRAGKGLTLSLGGIGLALGAAAVLYGVFTKRNADAKRKADDLRETLDQQTGAITGNTRAYVANDLAQSGLAKRAKEMGLNLSLVTDAALGNKSALKDLVGVLNEHIAAGTRQFVAGNRAGTVLTDEARAALALKNELTGTNGALTDAQEKQRLAAEGTKKHTSAQDLQKAAVAKANEKIKDQTKDLAELTAAAYSAAGGTLSLRDAENGYEAALDAVKESVKDNGHTLDVHTEKGRANREALDAIAASANSLTKSMTDNGYSAEAVAKKAEEAKKSFISLAMNGFHLSRKEAEALAAKVIAIPKTAKTDVKNNAAGKPKTDVVTYSDLLTGKNKAGIPSGVNTILTNNGAGTPKTQAERYADLLTGRDKAGIPKSVSTGVTTTGIPSAKVAIDGFATHVDRTLAGIDDESVRVSLFTSKAPGGHVPSDKNPGSGYATGGSVWMGDRGAVHGAGTSTSDSIAAPRLSDDEHVVTAKEVRGAGGHGAVAAMRASWAQGFAGGGAVGLRITPQAQSVAGMRAVASSIAREFGAEIKKERDALFGGGGPAGPPGSVRNFRGQRLNERTIRMLLNAEQILGRRFHITQGSYSTRVAASGGTHAGGGVMDTNGPGGWNAAVSALRAAGFAAWHRTPSQGPWGHHIHSVAKGDPSESASAKAQVRDFLRGGDGLGSIGRGRKTPTPARNRGHDQDGYARGGEVLSFDRGGYLPMGTSVVHNGTGRPEPVGHDLVRRGDLNGLRIQLDAPGIGTLTGHIRLTARDEVLQSGEFAGTTGRMGSR
jgi:TP901 family phage tail tape measure protein